MNLGRISLKFSGLSKIRVMSPRSALLFAYLAVTTALPTSVPSLAKNAPRHSLRLRGGAGSVPACGCPLIKDCCLMPKEILVPGVLFVAAHGAGMSLAPGLFLQAYGHEDAHATSVEGKMMRGLNRIWGMKMVAAGIMWFVIGRATNPINEKPSLQTLSDAFGALNAAYSAAAFIHAVLDKPGMASPQLPALVWSFFFAIMSFIFYQNGMNTKAAIPLTILAIVHGAWSVINPGSVFSTYREGTGASFPQTAAQAKRANAFVRSAGFADLALGAATLTLLKGGSASTALGVWSLPFALQFGTSLLSSTWVEWYAKAPAPAYALCFGLWALFALVMSLSGLYA